MHFRNELEVWQICTYNSNKIALFAAPKLNKRAARSGRWGCGRCRGGAGCRAAASVSILLLSLWGSQKVGNRLRQAWLHSITYIHTHKHTHPHTHTHTVSFRRGLCNVHGQNCSKQIFINAQIEQITVFLYAHTLAHTRGRHTHACSLAY